MRERARNASQTEKPVLRVRQQQMTVFRWPKKRSESLELRMLRRTAMLIMAVPM